eukprot:2614043-Ditylum_brightwellii.AAC.1
MQTFERGLQHHHSPCRTIRMQKADGTRAITDDENAKEFCEHFSKKNYNQNPLPCDHSALDLIPPHDYFTHLAELPSLSEVRAALHRMANGKAPGPSGITSDALKSMVWTEATPEDEVANDNANYLASVIHDMLVEFWKSALDFESWTSGILLPVPKKGDLSNPNKWCP